MHLRVYSAYVYIVFVTMPMYQTLCAIEKIVSEHFSSLKHIYVTDAFKECIAKIKLTNVLPLFCDFS